MDKRQRLFIYDRREMVVLILLSVMVALFAFTLGVHLGKRVVPQAAPVTAEAPTTHAIETQDDALPNRQDMTDQAPAADPAADEALGRSLHEEVARSGIQLDKPRPTELPRDTVRGAPTKARSQPAPKAIAKAPPAVVEKSEVAEAKQTFGETSADQAISASRRESPPGHFTLQVGSFPSLEEARPSVEALEKVGLRPFVREAEVKGKGRWFRVYVGGYANREDAQKAGQRYTTEQMVESFLVAKMVN